jgi:phosphatidylglycerol:prolipoprotein diacylglycerol transferase
MKPVLFEVFGVKIYGYGLMIAIGILVAMTIFIKKAKLKGYDEDSVFNMIITAVIGGIIGGKVLYIITEFKEIVKDPSIIFKDFGLGFVIYGAIMGGALAVYIYCRRKQWSMLQISDLLIPAVAIAQGFGRIGCFLAGCCYGAETTSALSVVFPEEGLAPAGVHLHPTQLYSSAFDFLLGFFLLWYYNKTNKRGRTLSLYLILYSIGRFMVEFIRNDPRGNVGILSTSQFIAIFTLVLGLAIYNIDKIKGRLVKSEL